MSGVAVARRAGGSSGGHLYRVPRRGERMATEEEVKLQSELDARLELVNSDPEYEGEQATVQDQVILAVVGLLIPAVLMIGGWLIYA
jgi:hypothetical protein